MIEIENLSKTYKTKKALHEVNLVIEQGSIFALLGPNGSGKSTLLKILLGLVRPDRGSILRLRGNQVDFNNNFRRDIAYMPQVPAFPAHLLVKEILQFLEKLSGEKPDESHILSELGVDEFLNVQFGRLSQGMKQKVNILQCFSFNRDILVVDEPTAGLDPAMAYYFKGLLKSQKSKGKTVIFTSHIMSEVAELAEKMAVLVDGSLILTSSPEQLVREERASSLEEAIRKHWGEKP